MHCTQVGILLLYFRWKIQMLCTCWRHEMWKVCCYMDIWNIVIAFTETQDLQSSYIFRFCSYPHDLFRQCCIPLYVCDAILAFTELAHIYKQFSQIDGGLQCFVKCLSSYLRETGWNLVTEEPGMKAPDKNAISFIQTLLDLKDQYDMFLELSFDSNQLFQDAIASVNYYSGTPL